MFTHKSGCALIAAAFHFARHRPLHFENPGALALSGRVVAGHFIHEVVGLVGRKIDVRALVSLYGLLS
jgi:hypothetical protein